MTTKRSIRWSLVAAAAACVAVAAMPGCELLVDFDRSKIPEEGGLLDSTVEDTSTDSPPAETSTEAAAETSTPVDAGDGGDATTDAPSETSMTDAPPEAATEASAETGTPETGAPESGADTGTEAGDDGGDDSGD